ncbi:MAG: ABC transporter permease subunit, partial [Stellaceae bacterium]
MASVTAAPPRHSIVRSTGASRIALAAGILAIIALVTLPQWGRLEDMRSIIEICYVLALAQCWNLLAGYAGLVSVGQQAFVGIGGYALFALTILWKVPPVPAVVLAGLIAAVLAVPTAFIVFRLRGAYFAIGTWVVAEVFRLLALQVYSLGGGTGTSLPASVVLSLGASRATRDLIT